MMAIVGPLTSLVLGGIFYLVGQAVGMRGGVPIPKNVPSVLIWYMNYINIALGIFNLIPGFPLDGGRVFRSIVWGMTHDLRKATMVATGVGQFFGWGFIMYGVYIALRGNLLSGVWVAFIGWFLSNAAESSRREVSIREYLQGVKVKDVMDPSPECVSQETSVESVVQSVFYQHGYRAAPVCENERAVGIVTITDVKRLPHEDWAKTPVSRIMTREPLYSVRADDDLNSALKLLAQYELNQLLVIDDDKLRGLLNRAHVIRYLQLNQEFGLRPRRQTAPRSQGSVT